MPSSSGPPRQAAFTCHGTECSSFYKTKTPQSAFIFISCSVPKIIKKIKKLTLFKAYDVLQPFLKVRDIWKINFLKSLVTLNEKI